MRPDATPQVARPVTFPPRALPTPGSLRRSGRARCVTTDGCQGHCEGGVPGHTPGPGLVGEGAFPDVAEGGRRGVPPRARWRPHRPSAEPGRVLLRRALRERRGGNPEQRTVLRRVSALGPLLVGDAPPGPAGQQRLRRGLGGPGCVFADGRASRSHWRQPLGSGSGGGGATIPKSRFWVGGAATRCETEEK